MIIFYMKGILNQEPFINQDSKELLLLANTMKSEYEYYSYVTFTTYEWLVCMSMLLLLVSVCLCVRTINVHSLIGIRFHQLIVRLLANIDAQSVRSLLNVTVSFQKYLQNIITRIACGVKTVIIKKSISLLIQKYEQPPHSLVRDSNYHRQMTSAARSIYCKKKNTLEWIYMYIYQYRFTHRTLETQHTNEQITGCCQAEQ